MNGRMAAFFSKRGMSVGAGNKAICDYCLVEKGITKSHHQYVSKNWNQFTSWLDNKIRSGVYKGEVVSTVNPSTWSKKKADAYYTAQDYKYKKKVRKQFDDFYAALTNDEKKFLKEFKSFVKQDNWLDLFLENTGHTRESRSLREILQGCFKAL